MRLPNPSPCSGQATATILLNRIVAVQECDLAPLKLREGAAQQTPNSSTTAWHLKLYTLNLIPYVCKKFKQA